MSERLDAPLVCYANDGPAFERLCPNCGRFMKFPPHMNWKETWEGRCLFPKVVCSKCGEVEPVHVGWEGDFI